MRVLLSPESLENRAFDSKSRAPENIAPVAPAIFDMASRNPGSRSEQEEAPGCNKPRRRPVGREPSPPVAICSPIPALQRLLLCALRRTPIASNRGYPQKQSAPALAAASLGLDAPDVLLDVHDLAAQARLLGREVDQVRFERLVRAGRDHIRVLRADSREEVAHYPFVAAAV